MSTFMQAEHVGAYAALVQEQTGHVLEDSGGVPGFTKSGGGVVNVPRCFDAEIGCRG